MGKITRQLIESLTPLEKESAEWCYEGYRQWLDENVKEEKGAVFVTAIVTLKAQNFQDGELEAFRSLHKKGVILDIEPDREVGGDCHDVTLSQAIVDVHNLLAENEGMEV